MGAGEATRVWNIQSDEAIRGAGAQQEGESIEKGGVGGRADSFSRMDRCAMVQMRLIRLARRSSVGPSSSVCGLSDSPDTLYSGIKLGLQRRPQRAPQSGTAPAASD